MDYFTRYGLEFNPFIKNSKEILVDTSEYRETIFQAGLSCQKPKVSVCLPVALEEARPPP